MPLCDDIIILTNDEQNANQIFNIFNKAHDNIKFEIEYPSKTDNNSKKISLLDIQIEIKNEGEIYFSFYTKSAKRNIFIHYQSALPLQVKINVINNEIKRIHERCSMNETKKLATTQFNKILSLNGYPKDFFKNLQNIYKVKSNKTKSHKNQTINKEYMYLKFPFLATKQQNVF